jgi:uncharacterized membrane protein
LTFILSFWLLSTTWRKYGKDFKLNKTVVPEFEIPDKLPPFELGLIHTNGMLKNEFISAALINLAVKGYLKIEQTEKKVLFKTDYKFTKLKDELSKLPTSERLLMEKMFTGRSETLLSEMRYKFYLKIQEIEKNVSEELKQQQLINKTGFYLQILYIAVGFMILPAVIIGTYAALFDVSLASLIINPLTCLLWIIFGFLMPKQPKEGVVLNYRIKGFKLYMQTAEKYRQRFNEKENLLVELLPYAIAFNLTKHWTKIMKDLGVEQNNSLGRNAILYSSLGFNNLSDLESGISQISSDISSSLSSSPSSSGGVSGGGGGGGGGGGW